MSGGGYEGRRVFVTGHTGFKGAWLSAWLLRLGAEVSGYALDPPTDPSLFDALGLAADVRQAIADVRDAVRLRQELVGAAPEVVFHLAAQPIVREGYAHPRETFETNVMGTVNLLEAVRECPSVRAVVVVTSDKCYRNDESGRAFVEDDPMGGADPYSGSKGCAELATAAYAASFFGAGAPAVATARAGNVIGGGDWAEDRIVPDCVRALGAGEPVLVRNPDAVRPWQHVLEPLWGYLLLAAALLADGQAHAGPWNFGPAAGSALPVRWVVERFLEEWPQGSWTVASGGRAQPHEAGLLRLDSAKARDALDWSPVWDEPEAVRRTASWYRRYLEDGRSAGELVDADLGAYEAASHATAADGGAP